MGGFGARLHGTFRESEVDLVLGNVEKVGQVLHLRRTAALGTIITLGLEGNVTKLKDGTDGTHHVLELLSADTDHSQGLDSVFKVLGIGLTLDLLRVGVSNILERVKVGTLQLAPVVTLDRIGRRQELVEHVVSALFRVVVGNTILLEQIHFANRPSKLTLGHTFVTKGHGTSFGVIELELEVFTESRRVVVTASLGVTKRLEQGIRLDDTLNDRVQTSVTGLGGSLLDRCHVVHGNLDGLGLTGSRLAGHQDRLVIPIERKPLVRQGRHFIDVRLKTFTSILVGIVPDKLVGIVGTLFFRVEFVEPLEGVDSDDNVAGTGVRLTKHVTLLEVVQDSSLTNGRGSAR